MSLANSTLAVPAAHGRVRFPVLLTLVLAPACLAVPLVLGPGFQLQLGIHAGVAAIGAIGLNLLTGNAGQVSLGHPFFLGVGAYGAAVFGGDLGLPMPLWLVACALLAAGLGALVGPFALRLRGPYLVMVTFALVFLGGHVFNSWTSVTGGTPGRTVKPSLALGPVDFAALPGLHRDQGIFLLVWAAAGFCAWIARNLLASRAGRAMMALRDREITAEVVGVGVARTKVAAFVLSSAMAGLAGGLYGAFVGYVSPLEWGLGLGIAYLAMIVVGGIGSVLGSVLGAVVITVLPYAVQAASRGLPFVAQNATDPGLITVFALNKILFGVLVIAVLMAAPSGLAGGLSGLARRFRARRAAS